MSVVCVLCCRWCVCAVCRVWYMWEVAAWVKSTHIYKIPPHRCPVGVHMCEDCALYCIIHMCRARVWNVRLEYTFGINRDAECMAACGCVGEGLNGTGSTGVLHLPGSAAVHTADVL